MKAGNSKFPRWDPRALHQKKWENSWVFLFETYLGTLRPVRGRSNFENIVPSRPRGQGQEADQEDPFGRQESPVFEVALEVCSLFFSLEILLGSFSGKYRIKANKKKTTNGINLTWNWSDYLPLGFGNFRW